MTMRFKDFVWPNNPTVLKAEEGKTVKEILIPFYGGKVENLGRASRKISGQGHFSGSDCMEVFRKLQEVFHQAGAGSLQLPGQLPFTAVMTSLSFIGEVGEGAVAYSFSFIEQSERGFTEYKEEKKASEGESLWKYAYLTGSNIDSLIAVNPHIRNIHFLKQGERVVIP